MVSIIFVVRDSQCVCDENYKGEDCSDINCPGEPDCLGRGSCILKDDTALCLCKAGFTGSNCSAIVCPGEPECSGRG